MSVQEQVAMPGTVSTTQDDGAVDEEQVNVSRVVCNSVFFSYEYSSPHYS